MTAAKIITSGGLVAFPTETVYGIGADVYNEESVKNIFKAKGRPADNPLIVHVCSMDMIPPLVKYIPDHAKILADAFMPGPITLIMKKSDSVPSVVSAGLDTIAIRFPSHPVAQKLIKYSNTPIPAPSANLSGKPSPTIFRHVADDMDGIIDAIIDGGECEAGLESTVVDCTGKKPIILRPGIITLEDIREYISDCDIDENILHSITADTKPKCPGMKYKHYAPNAQVIVIEGKELSVINKIQELINKYTPEKSVGVLSCSGHEYQNAHIINCENGNLGYAHSLFTNLRIFDEHNIDIILAEFTIEDKYSVTVKNRLYKSAGNNIIYV